MEGNMLDRATREGVNNFIGGLLIGLCVGGVMVILAGMVTGLVLAVLR